MIDDTRSQGGTTSTPSDLALPQQEYWYDLCDQYGIYLIDETNMETHGSWVANNIETPETAVPGSKPQWEGACVDCTTA